MRAAQQGKPSPPILAPGGDGGQSSLALQHGQPGVPPQAVEEGHRAKGWTKP